MELLIERCAGLDVHKASVTATVRVPDPSGGRLQQTRSFRATTAGLVLLGDWLASLIPASSSTLCSRWASRVRSAVSALR